MTYTLLRAYEYAKDNRLLPAGFDKSSADPDIGVYGAAASDPDFIGGSDQIVYEISSASNAASVTVELLFQTLSYTFKDDLAKVQTDLVGRFMNLYEPAANLPVVVSSTTVAVP